MAQRLEVIGGIQSAPDVFSPVEKQPNGTWFVPESFRVGNKWSQGFLNKDFIDATGAKKTTVAGVVYKQEAAGLSASPTTIQRTGYSFTSDPTQALADPRAVSFVPGAGTSKLKSVAKDVGPIVAFAAAPFAITALTAAAGAGASGGGLVGGGLKLGGGLGLKATEAAAIGGTASTAGTASLTVSSAALANATPALTAFAGGATGAAGGSFAFGNLGQTAGEALATAGKAAGAAGAVVQAAQTAQALKDTLTAPGTPVDAYPGVNGFLPESLPMQEGDAYITNNGTNGNMAGMLLFAAAAALFFIGRK